MVKVDKDELKLFSAIYENKKIGPKKVMISPTDRCNLHCKFCWRLNKEDQTDIGEELSLEEIKNLLKDCRKLHVKTIDLTGGGEPFIRKDIFEIIELTKQHGFEVTLTTNASFLTEKKIDRLIKLRLNDICFSLEGSNAKINDYLRGEGIFEKTIESIRIFNKLKRKHFSEYPILRIATVITKFNYQHLDDLIDYAVKNKITAINFSVMLEWESNEELSMRKEKDISSTFKRIRKKIRRWNLNSNIDAIIKYGLFEHALPNFCFAPWEMAFINSRGDVLACCILASYYENVVGNIKEDTFLNIWFSKKMEAFRRKIKQKEYFSECKRCLPDFVERYNNLNKKIRK